MTSRRWPVVLLALVCVGCGVRPSGAISGNPAPTGPVNGVTLFLVRSGELAPTLRTTATQLTPVQAVTLLAAGPTEQERQQGLHTEVPSNLAPANVTADASGITLDVALDPNSLSTMAVDQLVCTTQSAIADQNLPFPASTGFFIAGAGRTIKADRCP